MLSGKESDTPTNTPPPPPSSAAALSLIGFLLSRALYQLSVSEDIRTLYHLGFGTVTSSALIPFPHSLPGVRGLLANVFIANVPQGLVSLAYLSYDGLATCMLVADEWSRFGSDRAPLRCTDPNGAQTSTHFLSLPYRYAAPLMILSITLHWLVSQSIFLAQVTVFDSDNRPSPDASISTCGYSPIAIIFALAVGALILLAGLGLGFRRYAGSIPLAGSCSAAISAACHGKGTEVGTERMPLMWGVVSEEGSVIGHCAFSAEEVGTPLVGMLYAGKRAVGG